MVTTQDLLSGPQYWDQNMPQPSGYDTMQQYLDAVRTYREAQPWNQPAFGAPPDMSSQGPLWHAAGGPQDVTIGQLAARNYQVGAHFAHQPGVHSPAMGLAMGSRAALHPDEAQNAYNAYYLDPKTGLPVSYLSDDVLVALEGLGYRHPAQNPPNLLLSQTDPNYVRDEAARRQATIDAAQAGGGTQSGPVQRPGVNDPVQQRQSTGPRQPVDSDTSGSGGPRERPKPEASLDPQHQYPPDFLHALDDLRRRRPMTTVMGY